MAPDTLHASCLCGAVRWEVDRPLPRPEELGEKLAPMAMSHCHCARCRKAHGAPYVTFVTARAAQFRITQGSESTVRYTPKPGMPRAFCGTCGSSVPDGNVWEGLTWMPAGNFDEDPGVTPTAHIFVGSKAPWVELPEDGLPRFDTYPEVLGGPVMETRAPLDPDTGDTRGSCLCGAVAFVVTAPAIRSRTCHCSRCRKAGSAVHLSWLTVPYDGLRFTRGEEMIATYKVPEARYFDTAFCKACGSPMPRRAKERGVCLVAMGSLDDAPTTRPGLHIYVGSRAAWEAITDGAPQFEENQPG